MAPPLPESRRRAGLRGGQGRLEHGADQAELQGRVQEQGGGQGDNELDDKQVRGWRLQVKGMVSSSSGSSPLLGLPKWRAN